MQLRVQVIFHFVGIHLMFYNKKYCLPVRFVFLKGCSFLFLALIGFTMIKIINK